MNKLLRLIATLFLSIYGLFAASQTIIIQNISIIDVETSKVLENRDIYVSEGLIVKIDFFKEAKESNDQQKIIDGSGKFLMPGFIDTHAHFSMGPVKISIENQRPKLSLDLNNNLSEITGDLLLRHGITTARDPGGQTDSLVKVKKAINSGVLKGPEIFVAGSIIDTTEFENLAVAVKSTSEIIEEIRHQKELGVDFVKLYTSLGPEFLKIAIDEAHRLGLKTIGHLHNTSWTKGSNLGLDNIVHIIPGNESYLPQEKREEYQASLLWGSKAFFKWFELVDLESASIREMIQTLKKNNTSIDPTLVVFHAAFFGSKNIYKTNELLKGLPAELTENWSTLFNFNVGWTEDDFKLAEAAWPKVEKFLLMMYNEGVFITAGTDANNPWIVPGDSFHQELSLMVNAGIPVQEVLKIATINGAKLLKKFDVLGSIKEGKQADLIILNDNPLNNIDHTRKIDIVISNGHIIK